VDPSTAARAVTAVACGVGGLAVGSFLNVVAHRVPRGMSVVRPGSHCPACGTELRALDNVPLVSWLALGRRCRTCRVAIPARYPLVELAGGAGFAGLAVAAGPGWALPPLLLAVAVAIAAAAVDADGVAVPGALLVAGAVAMAALVIVASTEAAPGRIGWAALGGALAGAATWATDRRAGWRRAGVVAMLGWAGGWLWPPGGPLVAGWALTAWATSAAWTTWAVPAARAGAAAPGPAASPAAAPRRGDTPDGGPAPAGGSRAAVPLWLVAAGAYGLLLAGAVLGPPR
jgi:leader peptidase (prepilin peptidase) / N-methyltransferase